MKLDVEKEEQRLAALIKENEDISAKLAEKEQNKQNLLDEEKQKVVEVERQITEVELYLANNDEDKLLAEIDAIERQLIEIHENLDDDYSSGYSNSVDNSSPVAVPVFEKLTTDLASLFKNPNDFSVISPNVKTVKNQKPRSSGKHIRNNSSGAGSKKVRYGSRMDNSVSSIKQKSPKLVSSKYHQNLANVLVEKSPVVPSPVVISPPSDEKPQAAKILRVEILPAVVPLTDKAHEPSKEVQNMNPYVPRSLEKEYEPPKQQSDIKAVSEQNSPLTIPLTTGKSKLIPIPESPEEDVCDGDETAEEKNPKANQMEIDESNDGGGLVSCLKKFHTIIHFLTVFNSLNKIAFCALETAQRKSKWRNQI